LAGRGILGRDLRPVAVELLGHELRESGQRALSHLRARDADDDGVIRADHHPGVDFRRAVGGAHDVGTEWELKPQAQPAADRGRADQERTAILFGGVIHGALPYALAAAWIASRTCWKVPQRQMLVILASMSASVGFGLSLSSAATAMIIPHWQ